jgi:autotransporter-associated beta strand protein
LVALCLSIFPHSAGAAIATWTGSGTALAPTSGSFSVGGNWEGDVTPDFNPQTDLNFGGNSLGYTATNDLGDIQLNSVTVNSNASSSSEIRIIGGSIQFVPNANESASLTMQGPQVIRIGSNLELGGDLTVWRPISSSTFAYIGSGIAGGNINLGSHTLTITRAASLQFPGPAVLRIGETDSTTRGIISGPGKLVLNDQDLRPGRQLTLQLGSHNTYSGGTEVHRGELSLFGGSLKSNGLLVSGPFGTGPVTMFGGVLRSTGLPSRTLLNPLHVRGDFTFAGTGLPSVIVEAPITLHGSYTLGVARNTLGEASLTYLAGPIGEAQPGSGITWQMESDVIFTTTSSYTGPTIVRGATLRVNAPGDLGVSPLTLQSGGLSGDGTTADVTAETGATVSPGNGIGLLRSEGSALLAPGAHLSLELQAPAAAGYDQWQIGGSIDLSGADLQISLGPDPFVFGELYYLILNDGADPIVGTFGSLNGITADLSQGSRFVVSGQEFELSYTAESGVGFAGNGTDVAVRPVPEPAATAFLLVGLLGLSPRRRGRAAP